jgi:hypothetical protein
MARPRWYVGNDTEDDDYSIKDDPMYQDPDSAPKSRYKKGEAPSWLFGEGNDGNIVLDQSNPEEIDYSNDPKFQEGLRQARAIEEYRTAKEDYDSKGRLGKLISKEPVMPDFVPPNLEPDAKRKKQQSQEAARPDYYSPKDAAGNTGKEIPIPYHLNFQGVIQEE